MSCDSISPANPQPGLAAYLARDSPTGCFAVYFRSFHIPGAKPQPLAIGSGAMEAGSVEGAAGGLAVAPELLSHLIADQLPDELPAPKTVGDETRLFHWRHPSLFEPKERSSASFLVWRSGPVVAAIFTAGGRPAANDSAALQLARRQQARIESPKPFAADELDSAEVALEDPALRIPVYWLGQPFAPGHGLPKMRLYDSGSISKGRPRSPRVSLLYTDRLDFERAEMVYVNLWSAQQWERLRASGRRLPGDLRCAAIARKLPLRSGRALILRGVQGRRGRCQGRRHWIYSVRAHVGPVVATAETASICATCIGAGKGGYDTLRGMETIARGLRIRPRHGR